MFCAGREDDIRSYKLCRPTPPYYIYTLDCFILYQSLTDFGTEIENVFLSNLIFLIKIHLWLEQEDQRPQFLQVMYKVSLTFKLNQNLYCFLFPATNINNHWLCNHSTTLSTNIFKRTTSVNISVQFPGLMFCLCLKCLWVTSHPVFRRK